MRKVGAEITKGVADQEALMRQAELSEVEIREWWGSLEDALRDPTPSRKN